jgi:hypothetical protein
MIRSASVKPCPDEASFWIADGPADGFWNVDKIV